MNKKILSVFKISPDKPLHKCSLFWLSIISPLVVAFCVSIPLFLELSLCFSNECYSYFLGAFKLPFGVASLSIIFGVMVGRFHGSAQRAVANQLALSNNKHKSYYDHREAFTKWIENQLEKDRNKYIFISLENSLVLYKRIFPSNTTNSISVNYCSENLTSQFKELWEGIDYELKYTIEQYEKYHSNDLSPEGATVLATRLAHLVNLLLKDWGLALQPITSWTASNIDNGSIFEDIRYELSGFISKASEFSVGESIYDGKLERQNQNALENAWDEKIREIVTRTALYNDAIKEK